MEETSGDHGKVCLVTRGTTDTIFHCKMFVLLFCGSLSTTCLFGNTCRNTGRGRVQSPRVGQIWDSISGRVVFNVATRKSA